MRKSEFHSRSVQEFIVGIIGRELGMNDHEMVDWQMPETADPLQEMSYEAYKTGRLANCDTIVTVRP